MTTKEIETKDNEGTTSEYVLPYDPTFFTVSTSGDVAVLKSLQKSNFEMLKTWLFGEEEPKIIDFKVTEKILEFVNWEYERYNVDTSIFEVELDTSVEDPNLKYVATVLMEPHQIKLSGYGSTIVESLEDASKSAMKFWKDWDEWIQKDLENTNI